MESSDPEATVKEAEDLCVEVLDVVRACWCRLVGGQTGGQSGLDRPLVCLTHRGEPSQPMTFSYAVARDQEACGACRGWCWAMAGCASTPPVQHLTMEVQDAAQLLDYPHCHRVFIGQATGKPSLVHCFLYSGVSHNICAGMRGLDNKPTGRPSMCTANFQLHS
jgi:hypothetical protein